MTMKKLLICLFALVAVMAGCSSDDDLDGSSKSSSSSLRQVVDSLDSNYVYELPVVFHVLYNDENSATQYIPYQRLANILSYVNQIYQGNVYGESENINVKFVLATKDENGNTMRYPGVDYVKYTGEYPIDVNAFMTDNTGANVKYIWEPNNYINVMMFNFKPDSKDSTNIVLGISHMPYSVKGSNHQLEGLATVTNENLKKSNLGYAYCSAINSLYAGQQSGGGYYQSDRYTNINHQATNFSPADIVVTVAHELGHYLELYHDFTESKSNSSVEPVDSCGDTDYCADTYSYNRAEYLEYVNRQLSNTTIKHYMVDLVQRRSCDGIAFNADNIMDYFFTYGFKITKDQQTRIRNVLNYSPLIPGPKLSNGTTSTRASEPSGRIDLPITIIK